MKNEFDAYQHTYSCAVNKALGGLAPGLHDKFTEYKARLIFQYLQRTMSDPKHAAVLDVGCGIGSTDTCLLRDIEQVHGVDVSEALLTVARNANARGNYKSYDGLRLPYEDGHFDMTFAICVLHHVPQAGRNHFIKEMARVTKVGGSVLVFEHNPINPFTRCVVSRCEFDVGVKLVWPATLRRMIKSTRLDIVQRQFIIFSPFFDGTCRCLEKWLAGVPIGAQYYLAMQKTL